MFTISLLPANLQNFMVNLNTANVSRDIVTSIALARTLGYRFSLPTAPVETIDLFFSMHHTQQLNDILSQINEISILDIPTVLDLTLKFYKYRYSQAYPTSTPLALCQDKAVPEFFGIMRVFDQSTLTIIQENSIKLTDLCHKFFEVINTVDKSEVSVS